MAISKDKVTKLMGTRKARPTRKPARAPRSTDSAEPEASTNRGAVAGPPRPQYRRTTISLDLRTDRLIDEMTYRLKQRTGHRVSVSEILRTAVAHFAELPEQQQIERLGG